MMTLRPQTDSKTLEIFEQHIQQAVREFQINKTNETPSNREEVFLPSISQWYNKRIYAYVETFIKTIDGFTFFESIAGVQDFNGINMGYQQVTFVGAVEDSRISKVSLNTNDVCKIQLPYKEHSTWRGYAHFLLPNEDVTIINFELKASP